jgi:hypothetical protein
MVTSIAPSRDGRRVTFVRSADLREGDTLLAWWGRVRVVGFEPFSAKTAALGAPLVQTSEVVQEGQTMVEGADS